MGDASISAQLLDEVFHAAEPSLYLTAAAGGRRLIRKLLTDACSIASATVIADCGRCGGKNATDLSALAFPTALSAFADLSSFGRGSILGVRLGHGYAVSPGSGRDV